MNSFVLLPLPSVNIRHGVEQASVPTREVDGVPVAVQLVSRVSGDRILLDALVALYPTMQEDAKVNHPSL